MRSSLARQLSVGLFCLYVLLLAACQPEGLINKVKYEDNKYLNTCQSFQEEVAALTEANRSPLRLPVSEQNHTRFSFFHLEKGQYEIKRDTLYLRLQQDLNYGRFLDEAVAIEVRPSYRGDASAVEPAARQSGRLPTLVIDRDYFVAHQRGPYLLHKFPLAGHDLTGKQLSLSFAIAYYGPADSAAFYYCETDSLPLGRIQPSCCGERLWRGVTLPTVVMQPELDLAPQTFVYQGFTGTVDVRFRPNSTDPSDDSTFSVGLIQRYIDQYGQSKYAVDKMALYGFASPTGRATYNQTLSQRRAASLKQGLAALNVGLDTANIIARGYGEDWRRVRAMVPYASLSSEQKQCVAEIAADTSLTDDQREYALRRLPYYPQIKTEILGPARHTLATLRFAYDGVLPTVRAYRDRLPLSSPELWRVANAVFDVMPYEQAPDPELAFQVLDEVLTRTASPELYALRADYHLHRGDLKAALSDLEIASRFRGPESAQYLAAIEGIKVSYAGELSGREQQALLTQYETWLQIDNTDLTLANNRVVLLEKMGWLSTARQAMGQDLVNAAAWHNNRGVLAFKAFCLDEAQAAFETALRQDADLAEAHFNLAALYAYRGLPVETLRYLDRAIALQPGLKQHIFNNPVFSVVSEDLRFDQYREEE
mgnify:CR=1 FL=1